MGVCALHMHIVASSLLMSRASPHPSNMTGFRGAPIVLSDQQ